MAKRQKAEDKRARKLQRKQESDAPDSPAAPEIEDGAPVDQADQPGKAD